MNNPTLIPQPFAAKGNKNNIQNNRQAGQAPEDATWADGFPPITMTPMESGGLPPKGLDFNGVLHDITENIVHQSKGGRYYFDASFVAQIGGYSKGAVIMSDDNTKEFVSTVDKNLINPNINLTGWKVFAGAGFVIDASLTQKGIVQLGESGVGLEEDESKNRALNIFAFEQLKSNAANIGSSVYVPAKGKAVGVLGGTFRGYPEGIGYVQDENHSPIGMTGISKVDAYTVRIDHNHGFGRVGMMVAGPDETLAAMGVVVGASVDAGYSLIKIVAPLKFTCRGDGTITRISPLFAGSVAFSASSDQSKGVLRFTHPLKSVAAHQAVVSNQTYTDRISKPMDLASFNNDGGTEVYIHTYEEVEESVWITGTGTALVVQQGLNKAAYTVAMNAASGLITITHPAVKAGTYLSCPVLMPFKTTNRFVTQSISATQTTLFCYNSAGAVVKTMEAANISFFFNITPSVRNLQPAAILATNEFLIDVGLCHVPIDNLQNVPAGNIWFTGAMLK